MREQLIRIKSFPFLNFLKIQIVKEAGEHARAEIVGNILETECEEIFYQHHRNEEVAVFVYNEEIMEKQIFNGLLESFSIEDVNGLKELKISLCSRTILADQVKHIRTFQDENMTYSDVVQRIMQDSGNLSIIVSEAGNRAIEKMLVQYEETDWEFCKRIASRIGTYVLPNYQRNSSCFWIGMNPSEGSGTLTSSEYKIEKRVSEYVRNQARNASFFLENDALYYEVQSREIFELCSYVQFLDQSLYVFKIETNLVGSQLVHNYTLKKKTGFSMAEYFNEQLIGSSLMGNVLEVERDRVRVKIDQDVPQTEYHWFPYSTIYSSPDNTGWYFMPEINDRIRLHIPCEHEEESYVISCVHQGDRAHADVKSIRTKYQKEVVFYPDSIYISNGMGSHIELHDEDGITIESSKKIQIQADNDITMQSEAKIQILAGEKVTLQQADNQIRVEDTIDITAGHIRLR